MADKKPTKSSGRGVDNPVETGYRTGDGSKARPGSRPRAGRDTRPAGKAGAVTDVRPAGKANLDAGSAGRARTGTDARPAGEKMANRDTLPVEKAKPGQDAGSAGEKRAGAEAGPAGKGKAATGTSRQQARRQAKRETRRQAKRETRRQSRQLLSRERVLHTLQAVDRPLDPEELARQLGLSDPETLLPVLSELERDGAVLRTRKNRYGISKKMNLAVGVLQGHPRGFAFLIPDDKSGDIYIARENLGGAMHGDRVVVRPLWSGAAGKRTEGEVIRVLQRANERVVGRFERVPASGRGSQFGFVVPDEKRLGWDIFVPKAHWKGARSGDKVVVEITRWPEARRNPEGKIVEAFGSAGDPGVDILSIIKKYRLPEEFPDRVLREAEAIPQEIAPADEEGRWDLRELPLVTIDSEDARDLDDAVSLELLDSGAYRLGVHIADVAFYVKEGSGLDREAWERGTSVYLVDRVIPMLPPRLSNGICSLNAGADRLALSVFMEITKEGHLVRYEIGPSVIRVAERMTYTNVRRILDEKDVLLCQRYSDFVDIFEQMRDLCLILRQRRRRRGSLDFDFPECKVYVDEGGQPIDVCLLEQSIANQIIEEFMLMANETVAQHLYHLGVPLLYRVHEEPKPEKLASLNDFLHGFGYHIPSYNNGVHPRFFQDVLRQVEGKPEQLVVHTVMLRSMQHARYAPEPLGHFGLAVRLYTHFTSPIRRYPDLIVHRVLWEVIAHRQLPAKTRERLEQRMPEDAVQTSMREQVAEEAERETLDLKKVEYIRRFMGEIFNAVVSSVTNFGMFVALANGIEGLVHVSSMVDDYYLFDDRSYSLTGQHTGKSFKIGDKVRVQLVRASLEDRQIDFELVARQQ